MPFKIVTVSRALGAGGEDLGQRIADRFGLRYVDSEVVTRAAELAGVTTGEVEASEAPRSFVSRILEAIARAGVSDPVTAPAIAAEFHAAPKYEEMIGEVLRQIADEGNVVIVAHGAAMPLAGREGLLRILVTASPETRAGRVAATAHGALSARRLVEESDAAREQYFKRFYGVERELPTHYDLVINTDVLTVDQGLAAVEAVATTG